MTGRKQPVEIRDGLRVDLQLSMRFRRWGRLGWRRALVLGASALPLLAGATQPSETMPALNLGGPEVVKLDWNTRALRAADVDGDGRKDLLLINNDRATIELLLQQAPGTQPTVTRARRPNRWEPLVEDARFRKESVTTGMTMLDLAVGDLNGDGRVDLVYTGAPHALTLRYREADGGWNEEKISTAPEPLPIPSTLAIVDLDGDGRLDLVMLGKSELAVYRQAGDGTLAAPERYPTSEENGSGLEVTDFDGDGRLDLLYVSGREQRTSLRVRLQTPTGGFGPEQGYPLERMRSAARAMAGAPGEPAQFVYVSAPVGQVQLVRFRPAKEDAAADRLPQLRVFRPRQSGRTPVGYTLGDFNGDGRLDVAASDADGAQVSLYLRQPDGGFSDANWFPSLAEGQGVAAVDWDGDGRDELIVASAKERVVALARVGADGRLTYPQPLAIDGKPVAIAAARAGERPILAVAVEEKNVRSVLLVAPASAGGIDIVATIPLSGLRTDPAALRFWDADQDGRLDLAVFVPRDAMRLFVQGPDLAFTEASAAPQFRKGLVDDLSATVVSFADVDGNGHAEMLVGMRGFSRALRLSADGSLTVVEQFNARRATAEIATTLVLPRKDAAPDIVLIDRRGDEFSRLRRDSDGVYQMHRTFPAERLEVVGAALSESECFVFGADRFWWLPFGKRDFEADPIGSHTTDLPQVRYMDAIPADFDGDGVAEIIAIDPEKNLVEILGRKADEETWASRMHFIVFEVDPHNQAQRRGGPTEPREALVADVTADGRSDLVLLVHDRVLVYPQQ